jgi:hypothetical protein
MGIKEKKFIQNKEYLIMKQKLKKKLTPKRTFYINNDELIREIKVCYDTGNFTKSLGQYILKIIDGISHSSNFINYSFLDDMRGDALYRVSKTIRDKSFKIVPETELGKYRYDDKGNPIYRTDKNGQIVYRTRDVGKFGEVLYKTIEDAGGSLVLDDNSNPIPDHMVIRQNNAFGYLSMIIWHCFQNRIKVEEKHHTTVDNYKDKVYQDFELEFGLNLSQQNQDGEKYHLDHDF